MIGIVILISFIVFCIIIYRFFIKIINNSPQNIPNDPFYTACNEIEKNRAKEEWQREKESLELKREVLNSEIKHQLENCKNEKIKPYLEHLLKMESCNLESLDKKEWLWNKGNLRSLSEVKNLEWQKEKSDYYNSGQFKAEAVRTNIIAFFAPFLITFTIFMIVWWKHLWIFTIPIALIVALIASVIGMIIGHKTNLRRAEKYEIPNTDPQVQYERRELQIGFIAAIASTIRIAHHLKNDVKDIANVDSWKEIK